jgi:hypothetical protein
MDTRHPEELLLMAPHRGRYARLERQQEAKRDSERQALLERIRLLEEEVAWLQRERETA